MQAGISSPGGRRSAVFPHYFLLGGLDRAATTGKSEAQAATSVSVWRRRVWRVARGSVRRGFRPDVTCSVRVPLTRRARCGAGSGRIASRV